MKTDFVMERPKSLGTGMETQKLRETARGKPMMTVTEKVKMMETQKLRETGRGKPKVKLTLLLYRWRRWRQGLSQNKTTLNWRDCRKNWS